MLAYQEEPWLAACVNSLLASTGVLVKVVLVDNGCSSADLPALGALGGVQLLTPGRNLGYATGCNVGAAADKGDVLAFVNSDTIVEQQALSVLAHAAIASMGLVTASIRLGDQPDVLNSAGNPVHFLGFSWAGGLGESASSAQVPKDVASVSGACFGVTRQVWTELGGFPDAYFAYHEDVELSLRCWLSGRPVRYVPGAVVHHHYEFSRNPAKLYLLERNRLLTWLTIMQPRTLALLLPALLVAEASLALVALRQGWLTQKIRGWLWLLRHIPWILARRKCDRQQRRCSDRELAPILTDTFSPGGTSMPAVVALANMPLQIYWWFLRRLL